MLNTYNTLVNRKKIAKRITILGLLINLILVVSKLFGGIFGRSSAILADSFHSLSDLISDFFVLWGMEISHKPPDKCHGYGHGKYETFITFGISLLLMIVGLSFIFDSVGKILSALNGSFIEKPGYVALLIAFLSIFLKELCFRLTVKAGKRIESRAIVANAWHHRSDAASSVAAALGVGGAIFLGDRWVLLDPVAAGIVGFLIIFTGFLMFKESFDELSEKSLEPEKLSKITEIIESVDGVYNPHKLMTRKVGKDYVIDVHIEVNKELTVEESHKIATKVEFSIREKFNKNSIITVHTEPFRCL